MTTFALSRTLARCGLAALLAGGAGATLAQTAGGAQAPAGTPAVQTAGAMRYQCGGIGVDESTAMRAAMKDYPLSLLFARADGAYEANIDVRISPQGGSGETMQLRANGPVCLLHLPAGSYRVDVQGGGQSHSRTVQVGGSPKTLDFRF